MIPSATDNLENRHKQIQIHTIYIIILYIYTCLCRFFRLSKKSKNTFAYELPLSQVQLFTLLLQLLLIIKYYYIIILLLFNTIK